MDEPSAIGLGCEQSWQSEEIIEMQLYNSISYF